LRKGTRITLKVLCLIIILHLMVQLKKKRKWYDSSLFFFFFTSSRRLIVVYVIKMKVYLDKRPKQGVNLLVPWIVSALNQKKKYLNKSLKKKVFIFPAFCGGGEDTEWRDGVSEVGRHRGRPRWVASRGSKTPLSTQGGSSPSVGLQLSTLIRMSTWTWRRRYASSADAHQDPLKSHKQIPFSNILYMV